MSEWIIRDHRGPEMVMHPSTQGALAAMQHLNHESRMFSTILDLGCGSGILSLASSELWPEADILATDISPAAVKDATENTKAHERIRVIRSDAFSAPDISQRAPFGLMLCNLLAELLVAEARNVKTMLAPAGVAVLSGILAWKLPQVVAAYAGLGFEIKEEIAIGEWRTIVVAAS